MEIEKLITTTAAGNGVDIVEIKTADLGDELMFVCSVEPPMLEAATEKRLLIQKVLEEFVADDGLKRSIAFRAEENKVEVPDRPKDGLSSPENLRLRSLIDTRSRTTFAIPSLDYRESPKASMEVVSSLKNLVIYGRRGVGKTALMREAYSYVRSNLDMPAVWLNCQTYRGLEAPVVARSILVTILETAKNYGDTKYSENITRFLGSLPQDIEDSSDLRIPEINKLLAERFNKPAFALYCFLDDFYLLRVVDQPKILDFVFQALREVTVCLKLSTVANLTRLFDYENQIGLQIPHDAGKVDLDQTLEDPTQTQDFLEAIIAPYLDAAGVTSLSKLANPQARGRLILASGGVPRDYLSLVSMSMDKALQKRDNAKKITTESVNAAAGDFALIRQNELEADAQSQGSEVVRQILADRNSLRRQIIDDGRTTYFRVDKSITDGPEAERIGKLVDLRFIHLVWKEFSDKKGGNNRYDAYTLSLSEFSESRLFRKLELLDVVKGAWVKKKTGNSRDEAVLDRKGLRNTLVSAPVLVPFGKLQE